MNEAVSIVTSILCGICIYFKLPLAILCAVIALRSLLLFTSRTAMTKWIKIISPDAQQAARIKIFFLGFFLSTAVAGALAGLFLGNGSIWLIIGVDVLTYGLGLAVIFLLKRPEIQPSLPNARLPGVPETVGEILRSPALKTGFIAVCLSQAIFQGAYSILVSYLPVRHFGVGLAGTGIFQVAASIGIIGGFLINLRVPSFLRGKPLRLIGCAAAGVASLLLVTQLSMRPTVLSFLTLNLAYECIWLFFSAEFFQKSPAHEIARYQFTLSSVASFVMTLFTLGYAWSIDQWGLEVGVVIVLSIGLLTWIGISRASVTPRPVVEVQV